MRSSIYPWLAGAILFAGCEKTDTPEEEETCVDLEERFTENTVLPKGCYLAKKSPILNAGVLLTLDPGVRIIFSGGTGIELDAERALRAVGTADLPILLTGAEKTRGFWSGLSYSMTESVENRLEYVTVEYAGDTAADAAAAAVKVTSDSRPVKFSMAHTTIRESEGYGLFLVASTEVDAFDHNTLTKNTLGPVSIDSTLAGLLDGASTYTGNDVDRIHVRPNRLSRYPTWSNLDVPYWLDGNLHVDVPWTLDPGVTVLMSRDAWISVDGDDSGLHAAGTEALPILFTGLEHTPGYWSGIELGNTNNAANAFEWVTIEYAGQTASDADAAGLKMTADSHGVTASLQHTVLRENQGFGLYLAGSSVTPQFGHNTFTANGLGPVSVDSTKAHLLEVTSSYVGNGVDEVDVRAGRVKEAVTWQNIGVPYRVDGNLHVDLVWTLAPGVTVLMAQDAWMSIDGDESGFHAAGTEALPVTVTGIEKTNGYWKGIHFGNSNNASNLFEHATIEYGGSTEAGGETGMINASCDSHGVTLSVTQSKIQHSGQFGITLASCAHVNSDIDTSNTFLDNTLGNVNRE